MFVILRRKSSEMDGFERVRTFSWPFLMLMYKSWVWWQSIDISEQRFISRKMRRDGKDRNERETMKWMNHRLIDYVTCFSIHLFGLFVSVFFVVVNVSLCNSFSGFSIKFQIGFRIWLFRDLKTEQFWPEEPKCWRFFNLKTEHFGQKNLKPKFWEKIG